MEERLNELLKEMVNGYGVVIDSISYEREGGINYLRIALDREEIIPLDLIVEVTKAINPVLDSADLIAEEYTLDVYAKPKGEVK